MFERARQTRGPLLGLILLAGGLGAATLGVDKHPAHATTTQSGCSFTVPRPTIKEGAVYFTVTARCAANRHERKLDVELVGDDPSYDDALRWASQTVDAAGTHSVRADGWNCREDSTGNDEAYARARVEIHSGNAWRKGPWVVGSTRSGDCRSRQVDRG
jgi:hypothetical protein